MVFPRPDWTVGPSSSSRILPHSQGMDNAWSGPLNLIRDAQSASVAAETHDKARSNGRHVSEGINVALGNGVAQMLDTGHKLRFVDRRKQQHTEITTWLREMLEASRRDLGGLCSGKVENTNVASIRICRAEYIQNLVERHNHQYLSVTTHAVLCAVSYALFNALQRHALLKIRSSFPKPQSQPWQQQQFPAC